MFAGAAAASAGGEVARRVLSVVGKTLLAARQKEDQGNDSKKLMDGTRSRDADLGVADDGVR